MIYGIGVDIIELDRIKKAVKRWDTHFLNHVFTKEEIAYAKKHKFPIQHLAARFAAKEAIFKAIGDQPQLGWKDIEIYKDKHGKPHCKLKLKNFKRKILLSISHTHTYAVASAIITS